MDNSKTLIFEGNDGGSNGMMGLISALCQRQGLDPNMVMAMMNNRNGFGGEGGWFMWVIFLFFLMGWGGNGWGGFGNRNGQGLADLGNLINNDAGRELLMQAINGNGAAIGQLATTLNCDVNAINTALNGINSAICQVSNSVGLNSQAIINAIQAGNCKIAAQLSDCCCENRLAIANQTNALQNSINFVNSSVERGFAATNYAFADQTCQLKNEIAALKQYVGDQFCQDRMDQMARENRDLRDQVQAYQLSASQQAQTANIVSQLRPCPTPAYWVPNPFGCGCNSFGYPYGYNGGCGNGCGNGCGC